MWPKLRKCIVIGVFFTLPVSGNELKVEVNCYEELIDHGIGVTISAGPVDWVAKAVITETTIVDTHEIASYTVSRPHFPSGKPAGTRLTWNDNYGKFSLDVSLTKDAGKDEAEARGILRAEILVGRGRPTRIEKRVGCTLTRNEG